MDILPYLSGLIPWDAVFYFMKLIINGKETETGASTVSSLLEELNILPGRAAIEVNSSVIKKTGHSSYLLKDGDVVEIVNFVGGG